jgi:hypothetical protein
MVRLSPRIFALLFGLLLTASPAQSQDANRPDSSGGVSLPEVRAELLKMVEKDQAIRDTLQAAFQKYEGEVPDSIMFGLAMDMNSVDGKNAERIEEMFEDHGFPSAEMVGKQGVDAAFLLLQHAPLKLQEAYYDDVKTAYESGNLDGQEYALLTDRIRVRRGEKQLYGTQTDIINGDVVVAPVADSLNLDARRDSLGLPPMDAYLKEVRSFIGKE